MVSIYINIQTTDIVQSLQFKKYSNVIQPACLGCPLFLYFINSCFGILYLEYIFSFFLTNTNMSTSLSTIYTFTVGKSAVRNILMHMHKQGL
jgi:hypothetical protein